jgi:hypothetical protein
LLREARNVTYKSFVKPGSLLRLEVDCRRLTQGESDFVGVGYCNQGEVVKAKFGLTHFSIGGRESSPGPVDDRLAVEARAKFDRLRQ